MVSANWKAIISSLEANWNQDLKISETIWNVPVKSQMLSLPQVIKKQNHWLRVEDFKELTEGRLIHIIWGTEKH